MKSIIHLLLLFTFTALGMASDRTRQIQEDEIRETVFRYQFDHNASGQQKRAKAYFLSICDKDRDPSDEFMKRFAGYKPPVRKASACRTNATNGVVDKRTGEQGLLFRVTGIKWISDTEVQVGGGYYEAGLSASGNTYTVKKANRKWKVTADMMHWIS